MSKSKATYEAENPLGGPAKVFDAMAAAIRAGDDYQSTLRRHGFSELPAKPATLSPRELVLLDGMIEAQLRHASQCDNIQNRHMAQRQKSWDLERVELLKKLRSAGLHAQAESQDSDERQALIDHLKESSPSLSDANLLQIDVDLALAIGWKRDDMVIVEATSTLRLPGGSNGELIPFSHLDPAVIWPIAEHFKCFPNRCAFVKDAWNAAAVNSWESDDGPIWITGEPHAATAVAKAVIKGLEKGTAKGEKPQNTPLANGHTPSAVQWLAHGERGISSNTIFTHLTGIDAMRGNQPHHPLDPSDFRRCRLLLEEVPELQASFERMRSASPVWARLVTSWSDISRLMDEEAPDWRTDRGQSAWKTYDAIERVISEKK